MENQKKQTLQNILKYGIVALLIALGVYATIQLLPFMQQLGDPIFRERFRTQINSLGIGGVFAMLGIQVLQIILAVLPGEPVEVLMGVMYGTWGGLALCLVGIVIGQLIVFLLVRKFGKPVVELFFKQKQIEKFAFMQNSTRLSYIIFILFFIPGTPKDILCYIAGLTNIKISRFLLLSGIARIPSVVSSTWAGASLSQGDWVGSLLIFAAIGIIGLIGIAISNKVMAHLQNTKTK